MQKHSRVVLLTRGPVGILVGRIVPVITDIGVVDGVSIIGPVVISLGGFVVSVTIFSVVDIGILVVVGTVPEVVSFTSVVFFGTGVVCVLVEGLEDVTAGETVEVFGVTTEVVSCVFVVEDVISEIVVVDGVSVSGGPVVISLGGFVVSVTIFSVVDIGFLVVVGTVPEVVSFTSVVFFGTVVVCVLVEGLEDVTAGETVEVFGVTTEVVSCVFVVEDVISEIVVVDGVSVIGPVVVDGVSVIGRYLPWWLCGFSNNFFCC